MTVHRKTVPTYFGGLPATHDYINNAASGTPAPASNQQSGGTYDGSYFVIPAEFGLAQNSNRPVNALADNTDFFDDIVHTSRPVLAYEDFTAGVGGDSQIQITADVFVGRSGVSPINQEERDFLIAIVDQGTMQQLAVGSPPAPVSCSQLRDSADTGNVIGTEPTGYHTNPIVVFSSTVPVGVTYRVVYLRRATLVAESDPSDATGDMGYLAGYLVKSLGRGAAAASDFVAGESSWNDATSLTATDVQAAIDEVVDTLGSDTFGSAGALKVGAATFAGTGLTLNQGSVDSQLQQLANAILSLAGDHVWSGDHTFESEVILDSTARLTLNSGHAVDGDMSWRDISSSPVIGITKRSGTGANDGTQFSWKSQDGQNAGGSANNDGGSLLTATGAASSDGTGSRVHGSYYRGFGDMSPANRELCIDATVPGSLGQVTVLEEAQPDNSVIYCEVIVMAYDSTGAGGVGFAGGKWASVIERRNAGSCDILGTETEIKGDNDENFTVSVQIRGTTGSNWGVTVVNGSSPVLNARVWIRYNTFMASDFSP